MAGQEGDFGAIVGHFGGAAGNPSLSLFRFAGRDRQGRAKNFDGVEIFFFRFGGILPAFPCDLRGRGIE